MSIAEQILPNAQKIPTAEIVHTSRDGMLADVRRFKGWYSAPLGDALTGLCTVDYCGQSEEPIRLHEMVRNIGKTINSIAPIKWDGEFRKDSVIMCHGPLGERAGGLPGIGIDHHYAGWLNTNENDGEVTIVSTLPQETLEKAVEQSIENFRQECSLVGNTKVRCTDWINPAWNDSGSNPKINRYKRTSYSYWRKEFPAMDFHTVSGHNAVNEFLTVYGDIYSNVFGLRSLACFIKEDGSLEQRIWQLIKPEKAPKNHTVTFTKPDAMFDMAWILPETVRLARETVRVSKVTPKVAEINPELVSSLKYALLEQARSIRKNLGQAWIDTYPAKRYATTLHVANKIDGQKGVDKVNAELEKVNWFEATEIKPTK